jgi:hypothetical protein
MIEMKLTLCLAALLLILTCPAFAIGFSTGVLLNPSFETNDFNAAGGFTQLAVGSTGVTDWTVVNGAVAYGQNPGTGYTANDGSAFIDLTGIGTEPVYGGLEQTMTTNVDETYYIAFAEAIDGAGGSHVEALVDGTSISLTEGTTDAGWTSEFGSFVATGSSTDFTIAGVGPGNESTIMFVDGLRSSDSPFSDDPGSGGPVTTPEPTTLLLTSTGILALVRGLRKK